MAISDMMRSRSSDKLIAGPARSTSPWIWGMTDSTHHDREERNNYLRRSEGLVTGGQEQEASSETSHCKCLLDTELGGEGRSSRCHSKNQAHFAFQFIP